jgi:hypothetical protein
LRAILTCALALTVLGFSACGGTTNKEAADGGPGSEGGSGSSSGGSSSSSGGADAAPPGDGGPGPQTTTAKVDLLFMIDNSPSMGDKQNLLALAIPNMISRLTSPNCLDGSGQPTGQHADPSGSCPAGSKAEFHPLQDIHIGIVTSSLGSRGGDVCPDNTMNPANPSLLAHDNDNGELINRGGVPGMPTMESEPGTPDAPSPLNFLSYFPPVPANMGKPAPPTPAVTSATTLIGDFTTLIAGVHEHGCGFEAQNEAWYRFLVQPDPFQTINKNSNMATLSGVDAVILQQRAAFLRPDSAVAVIVVTDENEEAADPLSVAGQGWAFNQSSFPGSQSGGGAPQGTTECQSLDPNNPTTTGPNDPNCISCAFLSPSDPTFATRCPKNGTSGSAGYLDPANDAINLRYFHQKERFGLTSAYPTSRYVRGLQKPTVPSVGLAFSGDTDHEHDALGIYVGDQDGQADCVNPLFAQNLPTSAGQDLCHLTRGPRTPDLIFYAAIAGVPHQLLQATPGEHDAAGVCPAGTAPAECPQKYSLSAADWKLVMGTDPEHYDFRGADFHMVESVQARTTNTGGWANVATSTNQGGCQLDSSGTAPAGCDPVNGAEFDTRNEDVEFSCVFPLIDVSGGTVQSFQKDCTQMQFTQACDCSATSLDTGSQLCDGTTPTLQVNGKAYPSVREMVIAHAMATETFNGYSYNQGVVASLCPIHVDVGQSVSQAVADPLFGYNPAINALIARLAPALGL